MNEKNLVVIVDDDKFIRYAMKRYFSRYEVEVQTLNNGFEVLLFCSYRVPDLIISDIRMPKLDGITLLKGLKNNLYTKDVPVIFMSAYPSDPIMEDAVKLGAKYFLVKPFPFEYLENVIRRALPHIVGPESEEAKVGRAGS